MERNNPQNPQNPQQQKPQQPQQKPQQQPHRPKEQDVEKGGGGTQRDPNKDRGEQERH